MTNDVRDRVLTYDVDKRWACTGVIKGPGRDAGQPCGYNLTHASISTGLVCRNVNCERYGMIIKHPDLRSCEIIGQEEAHGDTRKSAQ